MASGLGSKVPGPGFWMMEYSAVLSVLIINSRKQSLGLILRVLFGFKVWEFGSGV